MADEPADGPRWGVSPALFAAATAGLFGALTAVLFHRPLVLVLAAPLLAYVLYALWSRPAAAPRVDADLPVQTLSEGEQADTMITVTAPGAATAAVWRSPVRWLRPHPPAGGLVVQLDRDGVAAATLGSGVERWGIHDVPAVRAVISSPLAAWRWPVLITGATRIRALPVRPEFTASDVVPRPAGMVGGHTSRRPGDSGELSEVRQFQLGDRLRRINWRVSSRTGRLHVTSTWSERDTEVQLVLDTVVDVGWSSGLGGSASSLDTVVRAASAIAEHYLRAGDRVSVVDVGGGRDVRAGAGRSHLRRINDTLVSAAPDRRIVTTPGRRLPPGSLMVVLSPLLGAPVLDHLVHGLQGGHAAVVIDTVPDRLTDPSWYTADMQVDDPRLAATAWRLRLAERQVTVDAIRDLGIPVVPWRGAGTLDDVLRQVSRPAPRMVAR